jgi:hypothetical protein
MRCWDLFQWVLVWVWQLNIFNVFNILRVGVIKLEINIVDNRPELRDNLNLGKPMSDFIELHHHFLHLYFLLVNGWLQLDVLRIFRLILALRLDVLSLQLLKVLVHVAKVHNDLRNLHRSVLKLLLKKGNVLGVLGWGLRLLPGQNLLGCFCSFLLSCFFGGNHFLDCFQVGCLLSLRQQFGWWL